MESVRSDFGEALTISADDLSMGSIVSTTTFDSRYSLQHAWIGWPRLVDFAVAALLVSTALLKAYSPADALAVASAFGVSYSMMLLVIQVELLVAALLVSGWQPRFSRLIASALFLVFAGFSLMLVLNGHTSCGCFGHLKTDPRVIFGLDLLVAVSLMVAGLLSGPSIGRESKLWIPAAVYFLTGPIALAIMLLHQPASLKGNQIIDDSAELIILEPESWIGEEFPLGPYLTPRIDVSSGMSIVLIYHHDCPDCQEALPHYVELANNSKYQQVVLAEVPPVGQAGEYGLAIHTTLQDDREWFVEAPVEVRITNGKVTAVERP